MSLFNLHSGVKSLDRITLHWNKVRDKFPSINSLTCLTSQWSHWPRSPQLRFVFCFYFKQDVKPVVKTKKLVY